MVKERKPKKEKEKKKFNKEGSIVEMMKVLHGEIGELGEKRSRTEINVMLKGGTCSHQENKREKKETLLVPKFSQMLCCVIALCGCDVIFIHL